MSWPGTVGRLPTSAGQRRVRPLFLVAMLALLGAVVAMHAMGAGHGGHAGATLGRGVHVFAQPAQHSAVAAGVSLSHEPPSTAPALQEAAVMGSCTRTACPGTVAALPVPMAPDLGAVCLAVLPTLALLLGLRLLPRGRCRTVFLALGRPVELPSIRAVPGLHLRPSRPRSASCARRPATSTVRPRHTAAPPGIRADPPRTPRRWKEPP